MVVPPKTRGRTAKASKENNENGVKKCVRAGRVLKPTRKALADKTNSASDDNASDEILVKVKQTLTTNISPELEGVRPRRERRLPSRFVENKVLIGLSNSKDEVVSPKVSPIEKLSMEQKDAKTSFKTPSKLESSLVANRPRRIGRLPSRFEDHLVSPNRYVPVQPCHASTPKIQNSSVSKAKENKIAQKKAKLSNKKSVENIVQKSIENRSPDTNNNPKKSKRLQAKKVNVAKSAAIKASGYDTSVDLSLEEITGKRHTRKVANKKNFDDSYKIPLKKSTLKTKKVVSSEEYPRVALTKLQGKRMIDRNLSFRVLEEKKTSPRNENKNLDVYEFTFDPDAEPPPQKKKRKRVIRKKPEKPKNVIIKSNYDQNVNKALTALKNAVAKKTLPNEKEPLAMSDKPIAANSATIIKETIPGLGKPHIPEKLNKQVPENLSRHVQITNHNTVNSNYHKSIQVEDIAADFESMSHNHDAINYSPVNTPRPITPQEKSIHTNDPLNLQEDFSFFDVQPVASSSMNVSVRHPQASPWRVEFGSLPIKWHANTYVKPNMTPAVESSFINIYDSNKKKHVYTNMVPDTNESLLDIVDNTKNLKQTSIISYIKEVVDRSASKKKRGRSVTPAKENSLFENLPDTIANVSDRTPKKSKKNKSKTPNTSSENTSKENANKSVEKRTKLKENVTYFGFDESDNHGDQENMSPVKVAPQVRALRPRSRAVLQEINAISKPTRAAVPGKSKMANSEAVNKVYEEIKSATDAPVFPDKDTNHETTNVDNADPSWHADVDNDDSQSVHLFEDVEVVHHLKPTRKSYGKSKKVTFRKRSVSDSDSDNAEQDPSSEEDNLADLSFQVPDIKEKKIRKRKNTKKVMSKKEEKEAEAWAAGFNSMCEDIEDFPLMVE